MTLTPGPTVLAAGDIADDDQVAAKTAGLLASIPDATILALGDNAYRCGTSGDYADHYAPTWGVPALMSRTRACPGNHEYSVSGCSTNGKGYFGFFANSHQQVWTPNRDFYSFEIQNCRWHIVSLNSEIPTHPTSPQAVWLRTNLTANAGKPILAFFHRPRVSSGNHGSNQDLQELWALLREFNTEIVLNGHDHSYERFLQQNAAQQQDAQGIAQFVIGTGGKDLEDPSKPQANSTRPPVKQHGVLKLVLNDQAYDWEFLTVSGEAVDSGTNHPLNAGH
jgi:hypothetical protein